MSKKINVNPSNSKLVNGRLFITALKMQRLNKTLKMFINDGNTVVFPKLGKLYEYTGPYSRA